jgi:glycosyltransferase involved in cell wall biosynthesis
MNDIVNTRAYWETRFQTDWDAMSGPDQSRFFSRVALELMPSWLLRSIRVSNLVVCDWGCAEGSGTAELSAGLAVPVVGIDFSPEAVAKAAATYEHLRFDCKDVVREDIPEFDVIFSSNTLEHFHEPWKIFDRLTTFARRHVALLLPFEEYHRISEHFHTFDANDMSFARSGFVLTHVSVDDSSLRNPTYWSGKQILAVYSRAGLIGDEQLSLADVRIDGLAPTGTADRNGTNTLHDDLEIARTEAMALSGRVEQLGIMFADEKHAREQLQREAISHLRELEEAKLQCDALSAKLLEHEDNELASAQSIAFLSREASEAKHVGEAIHHELSSERMAHEEAKEALVSALAGLRTTSDLLRDVESSISWKITWPLRVGRSLLLGGGQGRRHLLYSMFRSGYWSLPEWLRHRLLRTRARVVRRYAAAAKASPSKHYIHVNGLLVDAAKVAVVPCGFEFDELVNQRPINLAKYLAGHGYRVLFVAWQWDPEEALARSGKEVYPGVWQIGLYDLIDNAATLEPRADAESIFFVMLPAPSLVGLHRTMRERGFAIAYDMLDDWAEFAKVGQAPWFNSRTENEIILAADVVSAVSPPLAEKFAALRSDIQIIGNGYKPEVLGLAHEHCAQMGRSNQAPVKIGYFGHLTDAWFDWQVVLDAAREMPDVVFEIIGYGEPAWVREVVGDLTNIKLLGKVLPSDLWRHARAWRVGIIPFKPGALAAAVDPIKIYEYLYFGLPTVCTGIPHVSSLPDVRVADGVEDFVAACHAMSTIEPDYVRMKACLVEATWEARFDRLRVALEGSGIRRLYVA